jgi:hypothetical protein
MRGFIDLVTERSTIWSSFPQSSQTPPHIGQPSIATPCRSARTRSASAQIGHFLAVLVLLSEFR